MPLSDVSKRVFFLLDMSLEERTDETLFQFTKLSLLGNADSEVIRSALFGYDV